jgi:cell volume regulation protein A
MGAVMGPAGLVEVAVSVGMLCAAAGFALGLAIGAGRAPRWHEKGSIVHKVSIGFATLDRLDAVMLRFEVEAGSRLAGVEVDELRLPDGSGVALITRGRDVFLPKGSTVLRTGDQVLAISARDQVGAVEDRLRSVSRSGRLAGWYEALESTPARALGVRRRAA